MQNMALPARPLSNTDCNGTMTSSSTNLHFHGMNIPPKCHQDETLYTLINPGDPAFPYQFQVPADEPPGLYWYIPILMASPVSGVGWRFRRLDCEGIEKIKPEVAGLTQRVLVLRDQPSGPHDHQLRSTSPGTPVIDTPPSEKQFWRVLNAEADVFVNLQIKINGVPQAIRVVAIDEVPLQERLHDHYFRSPSRRSRRIHHAGPIHRRHWHFLNIGRRYRHRRQS